MELTILLSKVFGIYFLAIGVFMLFRRGWMKSVVNMFVEEPALRFVMGIIMFIGGLFVVVSHQDWSTFPSGFISAMGWAILIKALLYLNLSNAAVRKWIKWFNINGTSGLIWSLIVIGLGLYLTNFGFGLY